MRTHIFRDKVDRLHQGADITVLPAAEFGAEVFTQMQDPDDIVDIFLVDRNTGMPCIHENRIDLVSRGVDVQSRDFTTVDHKFIGSFIVEGKDVVDHLTLSFFNNAFFLADIDHHTDFFLRNLLFILFHTAEQFHYDTDRCIQNPDKRRRHIRQKVDRTGNIQRDCFRIAQPQLFRDKFAEDQRNVREQDRNHYDDDPFQRRI